MLFAAHLGEEESDDGCDVYFDGVKPVQHAPEGRNEPIRGFSPNPQLT